MPERPETNRPSGVIATRRMQVAGARACNAYRETQRLADLVNDELDEVTMPGAVPNVELHDEDSLVICVKEAIVANGSK